MQYTRSRCIHGRLITALCFSDSMVTVYTDDEPCFPAVSSIAPTSGMAVTTVLRDHDLTTCFHPGSVAENRSYVLVASNRQTAWEVEVVGRGITCSPVTGLSVLTMSVCDQGMCDLHLCSAFKGVTSAAFNVCRYRCGCKRSCSHILLSITIREQMTDAEVCEVIF